MKYFIAFALLVVAVSALSDEKKQQVKAFGEECLTSSGVEKEKITLLRQGTFSDDPKLKNFIFCVFKKTGGMNADGTFNKAVVETDFADSPDALKAALACLDTHGATPDDTAFETYKCYRSKVPAGYKTPW